MPGRGKPWKEGGTPDNTITSDDIKQGTIVGADIDPTYRSLIESGGGGGGLEVVGSYDVTTPETSMTATISPTIALGDIQELLIIAWFDLDNNDTVKCQISGLNGSSDYSVAGWHTSWFGEGGNQYGSSTNGLGTTQTYLAGGIKYLRISVVGQDIGGVMSAVIDSVDANTSALNARGWGRLTTSISNFDEVKLVTVTNNFTAGSSLRVYKINRT